MRDYNSVSISQGAVVETPIQRQSFIEFLSSRPFSSKLNIYSGDVEKNSYRWKLILKWLSK